MPTCKPPSRKRPLSSPFSRGVRLGLAIGCPVAVLGVTGYVLLVWLTWPAETWRQKFSDAVAAGARGHYAVYGRWPTSLDQLLSRMDPWAAEDDRKEMSAHGMTMEVTSAPDAPEFYARVSVRSPRLEFEVNEPAPKADDLERAAGPYFREAWQRRQERGSPARSGK